METIFMWIGIVYSVATALAILVTIIAVCIEQLRVDTKNAKLFFEFLYYRKLFKKWTREQK